MPAKSVLLTVFAVLLVAGCAATETAVQETPPAGATPRYAIQVTAVIEGSEKPRLLGEMVPGSVPQDFVRARDCFSALPQGTCQVLVLVVDRKKNLQTTFTLEVATTPDLAGEFEKFISVLCAGRLSPTIWQPLEASEE